MQGDMEDWRKLSEVLLRNCYASALDLNKVFCRRCMPPMEDRQAATFVDQEGLASCLICGEMICEEEDKPVFSGQPAR